VQALGFAHFSSARRFARFAAALGGSCCAFLGFTRPARSFRFANTIRFASTAQLLLEPLLLLAVELLLQIGCVTHVLLLLLRLGERSRQMQLHRHDRYERPSTGPPAHLGPHGLTVNWPRCERKVA